MQTLREADVWSEKLSPMVRENGRIWKQDQVLRGAQRKLPPVVSEIKLQTLIAEIGWARNLSISRHPKDETVAVRALPVELRGELPALDQIAKLLKGDGVRRRVQFNRSTYGLRAATIIGAHE